MEDEKEEREKHVAQFFHSFSGDGGARRGQFSLFSPTQTRKKRRTDPDAANTSPKKCRTDPAPGITDRLSPPLKCVS